MVPDQIAQKKKSLERLAGLMGKRWTKTWALMLAVLVGKFLHLLCLSFPSSPFSSCVSWKWAPTAGQRLTKDLPLDHLCPIFVGLEECACLKAFCSHLPSAFSFPNAVRRKRCRAAVLLHKSQWDSGLSFALQKYFQEQVARTSTATNHCCKATFIKWETMFCKALTWKNATEPQPECQVAWRGLQPWGSQGNQH